MGDGDVIDSLWLILEEAHSLDVVSLVEGEAVVNSRREDEEVARAELNANPLGVLVILRTCTRAETNHKSNRIGVSTTLARHTRGWAGEVVLRKWRWSTYADIEVTLAIEDVTDLLVLVQVSTASWKGMISSCGNLWMSSRTSRPGESLAQHVLRLDCEHPRSSVWQTYVKKPLILVS